MLLEPASKVINVASLPQALSFSVEGAMVPNDEGGDKKYLNGLTFGTAVKINKVTVFSQVRPETDATIRIVFEVDGSFFLMTAVTIAANDFVGTTNPSDFTLPADATGYLECLSGSGVIAGVTVLFNYNAQA